MYQGRALSNLAAAAIFGFIVTCFVALGMDLTLHPQQGSAKYAGLVLIGYIGFVVTVVSWWGAMYLEIRGKLVSHGWSSDE